VVIKHFALGKSRFLQEYKSETSHTLEDGHVGRKIAFFRKAGSCTKSKNRITRNVVQQCQNPLDCTVVIKHFALGKSRFLQEYKSKTSHTLEDGHVGQTCSVEHETSTIKLHADGNITSKTY
jgi:hypothetical protein